MKFRCLRNAPFDLACVVALQLGALVCDASTAPVVLKPLFADPNYHGSCDPEAVWNERAGQWWVFYTARRATRETASYVGTPIGVIASRDLSAWQFLGYASFDGQPGRPDMPVTFWAPGIIRKGDTWHMYVTFKPSATPPWGGDGEIRHYTAPAADPLHGWTLATPPQFPGPDPIDATLLSIGGETRAYYRVGKGGGIQWSSSRDLTTWTHRGKLLGDVNAPAAQRGFDYQEAPYVFRFADAYWLLTDPHRGLAVYRSSDAITWTLQGRILDAFGTGPADATLARHPSVTIVQGRAFLFYHTEPNRPYPTPPPEKRTVTQKISFLQVAELRVDQGQLTCERDIRIEAPSPAMGGADSYLERSASPTNRQ